MLVVTRNDKSLRRPLRAFLAAPDPPTGLLVNVHYRPGPYMVGDETIRIAGRASIRENALGPAFLVSPTAFFQTNPEAAAALLADVLRQVGARGRCRQSWPTCTPAAACSRSRWRFAGTPWSRSRRTPRPCATARPTRG